MVQSPCQFAGTMARNQREGKGRMRVREEGRDAHAGGHFLTSLEGGGALTRFRDNTPMPRSAPALRVRKSAGRMLAAKDGRRDGIGWLLHQASDTPALHHNS